MTILNENQDQVLDEMSSPEKMVKFEAQWAQRYIEGFRNRTQLEKHDIIGNELHIGDWCLNPYMDGQSMDIKLVRVIGFAKKTIRVQHYKRWSRDEISQKCVCGDRLIKIDFDQLKKMIDIEK